MGNWENDFESAVYSPLCKPNHSKTDSYKQIHSIDVNILAGKESSIFLKFLSGRSDFKNSINKDIVKTT